MHEPDLDTALTSSLNRRADSVRAAPTTLAYIERRAGRLRARRRRRRLAAGGVGLVVVVALITSVVYAARQPGKASVEVTNPGMTAPARHGLASLVDTTKGHTCPSIGKSQPTPPTTLVAGMESTSPSRVLVPTTLAPGYCATTPYVTLPYQVDYPFTVLASCSHCDDPRATVAISTSTDRDTWSEVSSKGEATGTLDGHTYGYLAPTSPGGRAMLAWPKNVAGGRGPSKHSFLLIGYGLAKADYLQLASQLARSAPATLPGLTTVYTGDADAFDVVSRDVDRDVVTQWVREDGHAMLTYSYQHTARPVSLAAYAWDFADAHVVQTSMGPVLYGLDPDSRGHMYSFLLVTKDADIAIEYVSTEVGPPPDYLISVLDSVRGLSTGSSTWKSFANLAGRHTSAPETVIGEYDSLDTTFEYANP